ncbi:hypothetical protein SEA_ZENITSU_62 [Microbacterium phage Zenitsu]|uniref:Uncharacterized protein n=1 Tax=Microbacterium phage MCubed TaxID=2593339 RepID=A0A514U428_9CAUD|nr:hypothetical protein SEA_MCUBED_62 [Microbacterium phage MCubed]WNN93863.1 hypothetical protein SEA_ZENITSU_62 [Microbacterium phage Zenitsu]
MSNTVEKPVTESIEIPIRTLTRMGEVRPSDARYVEPMAARSHVLNEGAH